MVISVKPTEPTPHSYCPNSMNITKNKVFHVNGKNMLTMKIQTDNGWGMGYDNRVKYKQGFISTVYLRLGIQPPKWCLDENSPHHINENHNQHAQD